MCQLGPVLDKVQYYGYESCCIAVLTASEDQSGNKLQHPHKRITNAKGKLPEWPRKLLTSTDDVQCAFLSATKAAQTQVKHYTPHTVLTYCTYTKLS